MLLSRLRRKYAKLPSIEIAPASVAVIVIVSVAMLDMGEFVRHHGGDFLRLSRSSSPSLQRPRHFRIASGRKALGCGLSIRYVWASAAGARRKAANDGVVFRRVALVHLDGPVHRQHHRRVQ